MASEAPTLDLEKQLLDDGHRLIAGVDEVGRGSLAGPVVAAAVVLPLHDPGLCGILDEVRESKQLPAAVRIRLAQTIVRVALGIGVGWSSHHVIDREGIGPANRAAMARAVRNLAVRPDALLIDYERLPTVAIPQLSVPHGDARSLSIAAASVVAKVMRDRYMTHSDALYPDYGFAAHKGYSTRAHLAALDRAGPCRIHRRSFRPVAETAS